MGGDESSGVPSAFASFSKMTLKCPPPNSDTKMFSGNLDASTPRRWRCAAKGYACPPGDRNISIGALHALEGGALG